MSPAPCNESRTDRNMRTPIDARSYSKTVTDHPYSAPIRLLGKKAQTVPTTERIVEMVIKT